MRKTFGHKVIRHWAAILLLGVTLSLGAISLVRSVGTLGQPFAGFFFGPNLLVAISQREHWPGIEAGLRSLDQIVAVDGVPVASASEILTRVAKHQPGESLIYHVVRKGQPPRDVGVAVTSISLNDFLIAFLAPFVMGLLFVSFGAVMYFAQPAARGSLLYLALSCVIGMFCMVIYEAYTTFTFFRLTLLYPLIGALSAHLFSLFSESRSNRWRTRFIYGSLYVLAIALVTQRQISLGHARESVILSRLSSGYVLMALAANLLLLARAYHRATLQAARDKIKVIVIALLLASSVVAAWSLNFLLVTKTFYLDEGVLLASIFPVFMGYAILRRNVFGLDRVIRLSLSYGIAAAVIVAGYLAFVAAVREFFPGAVAKLSTGGFLFILAALGAVLFNMVRRRVNVLVHQLLFRNQYDLAEALAELDRSIGAGLSVEELADRVGRRLTELLGLERTAMIVLPTPAKASPVVRTFRWENPPELERWASLFEAEGFLEELRVRGSAAEILDLEEEILDRFRQSLATLKAHEIEVALPLVASGKLFGVLFFGRKLSRDRYDQTDFKLLQPIAVRVGLGLENAALTADASRQGRLAALGQVASLMIHDIKNPLSTIKISAGTIKNRFREGDHSYELATFIEEEVDRMNQKVQQILTFAKPVQLSLGPCSINGLITSVADAFRPLFEKGKVSLALDLTSEELPLAADEPQLRRAVENLLVNAMEATSQGGSVTVRTESVGRSNGHAKMLLSVEDTGAGMEASIRERIFQPFFTTKEGGTGLGLAIVKQIVEEHGGELELQSWPGKGSRFVIHLPASGA
ncbi:MAG TPA: ATP-binding protein [Bdellovibrionota bacterium]|nr:ATP-binding protein [Bdellovibrionota bacterium]